MNQPKRHHYIPQFILKNFSSSGDRMVNYFDIETKASSCKDTRDVFMAKYLYPLNLEHDFSVIENEVSRIIKNKFLADSLITITDEEDQKLRLFFAVMGFRSERTKRFFEKGMDKKDKKFYKPYQKDGNFLELWKRNLGFIVNCRSIQEVLEHDKIDPPIKTFVMRDTFGLLGIYFAVVEAEGTEEFVIGDCYPLVVTGERVNGYHQPMYSVYPISPSRAIFMMSCGVEYTPQLTLGFRPSIATTPKKNNDNSYSVRVKKMYPEEIKEINEGIYKASSKGIVYKSKFCFE